MLPEYRRRGLASGLLRASLADQRGRLYLRCGARWESYFERFGFRRMKPSELPPDLRREHRIGRLVVAVRSLIVRRRLHIIPMKRG